MVKNQSVFTEKSQSDKGLTRREAAEFLGVYTEKTLANLATLNQGPPFRKHRGRVIYLQSELLAWLRSLPVSCGAQVTQ